MTDLHASAEGRAMIEQFEGCRLRSYQDIVGVWTVGYGCTGPGIGPGLVITQEEADSMFAARLDEEFEPALNSLLGGAPTTQGQFDAMLSLAFNIGTGDWQRIEHRHRPGGFADSEVLQQHLAGSWTAAANDFLHWDHASGHVVEALTRRRQQEAQLYLRSSPAVASAGQETQETPPPATPAPENGDSAPAAPAEPPAGTGDPADASADDLNAQELRQLRQIG